MEVVVILIIVIAILYYYNTKDNSINVEREKAEFNKEFNTLKQQRQQKRSADNIKEEHPSKSTNISGGLNVWVDASFSILNHKKDLILDDKKCIYVVTFYMLGSIDMFSQKLNWSEEKFIDISRETLEYLGIDLPVIEVFLEGFNEMSQTELGQECMQDGAKSFARFLNKDSIAMTGLQYMLTKHTDYPFDD